MEHAKDLVKAPCREIKIGYGNNDFTIRQITDLHIKGDGFREDLFGTFINIQKRDKNSVWTGTGDMGDPDRNSRREIDNIANANRSSEIITQNEKNKLWVENYIIPKLAPIADSCIGLLAGDHYMMIDGKPCTEYICKRLKIPYLGERSSFVVLNFLQPNNSGLRYIIHARHGKTSASTQGGDLASNIKANSGQIADLFLGGHTHKANTCATRIEFVNSHGYVKNRVVWYMRGGSFLDSPGYAKKAEYTPLPVGWGEVELTVGRIYHGEGKSCHSAILRSKCSIIAA